MFNANGSTLFANDISQLNSLKKCWIEFNDFYLNFIKDLNFYYSRKDENGIDIDSDIINMRE